VALNRVGVAIDLRGMLVKKARSLPRVAHSVELPRMTHLADKRAAQKALEIESGIGLETPGCAQPRKQMRRHAKAAELAARKDVGMVDAFVAAQKRGPFGIDDPGDLGLRAGVTEKRRGGQSVHDVAERTRFDDEDGRNVGFQNRLVIPDADEGSGGEMLKQTPRDCSTPL